MSFQLFSPSSNSVSLVCFMLLLVKIQPILANSECYLSCSAPFRCGEITVGYPFWGGDRFQVCGHPDLELRCEYDSTTMMIHDVKYRVLNVDQKSQVLKIARQDSFDGLCPQLNTTIDSAIFDYSAGYQMLELFYDCPFPRNFTCFMNDVNDNQYRYSEGGFTNISGATNQYRYWGGGFTNISGATNSECRVSVHIPVKETLILGAKEDLSALKVALEKGFEVKWKLNGTACENCRSCGYDVVSNQAICYCPGEEYQTSKVPPKSSGSSFNKRRKIYIGIAASVVGIIVIIAILLFIVLGQLRQKKTEDDQTVEAFIRNYGSLAPKRYNYSDVKRMTKSFSDKLGQGGYGDVYKGVLLDGRLVAVKVLKNSKYNAEEFINEVASISRTSHINIVTFLGFCYEKQKRALIYEFMPNGSLDKYIYDQETLSRTRKLEWRTKYEIAVGIARGLEYLHRGCNIRIVHFDIKPHNILLDEDFSPRISDFGLAKQSEKKAESIISMLDARGTIGYIAPEVFCRNFGGVSHKSDVYSYGMMILEMVVGRKNADVKVSSSSEIYFPNSIYKHIEPGNEFQLGGVVTEEETEMAKKMVLVSLWCIQTNPSDRPSMHKVLEMLEVGIENLQVPPKPSLSSPIRSAIQSTAASLSSELASQEPSCS